VDLSEYAFGITTNGAFGTHEEYRPFPSSASIPAKGVYTICNSAMTSIYCDELTSSMFHSLVYFPHSLHTHTHTLTDSIVNFNGDDGRCLLKGTASNHIILDCVGDYMGDPGAGWEVCGISSATKDNLLTRKCDVKDGNRGDWEMSRGTNTTDCEWIVQSYTTSEMGSHDCSCSTVNCELTCWDVGSLDSTPFSRCTNFQDTYPSCDTTVYLDSDTDGQTNSLGYSCADIQRIFEYQDDVCTSSYDTRYFTSTELCAVCGGGVEPNVLNVAGSIKLNSPLVSLEESSSNSSSTECDLRVQRVYGNEGEAVATVVLMNTDLGVCGQSSQYNDLNVSTDLQNQDNRFNLSWSDQDNSDRCLQFNVVDDKTIEGDEAICVYIENTQGASIETSGQYSLLVVSSLATFFLISFISQPIHTHNKSQVKDNDFEIIESTNTMEWTYIVIPSLSVLLLGILAFFLRQRIVKQRQIASYIPLRRCVEVSKCSVKDAVTMIERMTMSMSQSAKSPSHFMERLNSSTSLLSNIDLSKVTELREALHYIVSIDSEMCRNILEHFLSTHPKLAHELANLTDNIGRKAIHVALKAQRETFEKYILLCGRYRINPGPVVHRSKTCEVVFGVDARDRTVDYPDGRPVALKMMYRRDQWECEIRSRQKYNLGSCVVKVLGWHCPKDEETIRGNNSRLEPMSLYDKYKYLLVLERGDSSVHRTIVTQRIAGFNIDAVSHLGLEIAQNVKELHDAGLVHYDLKIRNILVSSTTNKKKRYVFILNRLSLSQSLSLSLSLCMYHTHTHTTHTPASLTRLNRHTHTHTVETSIEVVVLCYVI